MSKHYIVILLFLFFSSAAWSQNPTIEWTKTYGGAKFDGATAIVEAENNTFLVAGSTESTDGDIPNNRGESDIFLLKIDKNGNLLWRKTYGGSKSDAANAIIKTIDGGYMMVGSTNSTDGQISNNKGMYDAWLIKIDTSGQIQWEKTIGGSNTDAGLSVIQNSNGDYIVAITAKSIDKDFPQNQGDKDCWLVKLSVRGDIIWKKNFGGTKEDVLYDICAINDSSFVAVGETLSEDRDMAFSKGEFIIRFDSTSKMIWSRSFGFPSFPSFRGLMGYRSISCQNKFLIAVGTLYATRPIGHNYWEFFVTKLDTSGNLSWSKYYGGSETDIAMSAQFLTNGEIIVSGYTQSNNADIVGNNGLIDMWVLRLDSAGLIKNAFCIGGSGEEYAIPCLLAKDNALYIAGFTDSVSTRFPINRGKEDLAFVKLRYGDIRSKIENASKNRAIKLYPNPVEAILNLQYESDVGLDITLFDSFGRLLASYQNCPQNFSIPVESLKAGVYILKFENLKGFVFQKFIKH